MHIYVASSWKNTYQPTIVDLLRKLGHEVYDFRNPSPGNSGFSWSQIDPNYSREITAEKYKALLASPIAEAGYLADITALRECEACVYVLPCGRSASWEFGYAMAQGKQCFVCMFEPDAPDLMFMEAAIIGSFKELEEVFG